MNCTWRNCPNLAREIIRDERGHAWAHLCGVHGRILQAAAIEAENRGLGRATLRLLRLSALAQRAWVSTVELVACEVRRADQAQRAEEMKESAA